MALIQSEKIIKLRESFKITQEAFAESLGVRIEAYIAWEEKGITDEMDLIDLLPVFIKGREVIENKIILNFVNTILESMGEYDYMKRLALLFNEYSATRETMSQSERDFIRFKLSNIFLEFIDKMIDDRKSKPDKRRKKGAAT